MGARVRKRYQAPRTPCARLTASEAIDQTTKQRLQAVEVTLDPLRLLDEIRSMQHHIAGLSRGEHVHVPPHRDADLDRFLRSLETAWKDGDVRPTHASKPKPARHWRTRRDPFAEVWPKIVLWLEQEPDQTATDLLVRLRTEHPGKFKPGQVRTLQRRVREWRAAAARRLLFVGKSESGDSEGTIHGVDGQ